MSDKPEETGWQGFLRKTKYQAKNVTMKEQIIDAIESGFLDNYNDAIDKFDEVLQYSYERWDKEERALAFSRKAHMLEKLGKDEEALLTHDKAIEANPDEPSFSENKGVLLLKLGRYPEAIICFSKSVELTKKHLEKLGDKKDQEDEKFYSISFSGLAEAYAELPTKNDLDLALKYADEAIKHYPENPDAYRVKATVYADETREKYDEALENCEKGLKIDPTDEDLLSLRALIYLNMEKYDLAEKHFLELLNHDPSEPSTHYNLACIYSLLKNKQKAIDHLLVATYLDPATTHSDMDEDESFDNIRDSEEFKRLQSVEV
jgi:tetratricopeptide (TPR) repeat protein